MKHDSHAEQHWRRQAAQRTPRVPPLRSTTPQIGRCELVVLTIIAVCLLAWPLLAFVGGTR